MSGSPLRKIAFVAVIAITSCLNGLLPASLRGGIKSMAMIAHQTCVISKERPYVIPWWRYWWSIESFWARLCLWSGVFERQWQSLIPAWSLNPQHFDRVWFWQPHEWAQWPWGHTPNCICVFIMNLPPLGSAESSRRWVLPTCVLWRLRLNWGWVAGRLQPVWWLGTRRSRGRLGVLTESGTWWQVLPPYLSWFRRWWRWRSRSSICMVGWVHVVFGNCLQDGP